MASSTRAAQLREMPVVYPQNIAHIPFVFSCEASVVHCDALLGGYFILVILTFADDNVSQVRKVGQSLRESVEFSFSFWCDLHADRGRARCPTRDTRVLKAHH